MSFSSLFPFSNLTNAELLENFNLIPFNCNVDFDLKNILTDSLSNEITDSLEFKYYTPDQINTLSGRYPSSIQLSIFHVNIRSLNSNYNKLIAFLQCLNFNFDILILSEIWSTNLSYYVNLLQGYNFFFDSPDGRAGGVGIYVKNKFNAIQTTKYNPVTPKLTPRTYESVWIEIPGENNCTVIGGFYRHPNTSVKDFTDAFLYSLDKLKNIKHCYICGDVNISLSNYSSSTITRAFVDSILDAKFLPYVFMPTRFTNHSSTIIDHVYSNDLFTDNRLCKTGLLVNDIADHCANFMFIIDDSHKTKIKNPVSYQKFRCFSKINTDKFHAALASFNWNLVFNCIDPNTALNMFISEFTSVHDSCFPFVTVKTKDRGDKKWITPALIKSINLKCKLYKK